VFPSSHVRLTCTTVVFLHHDLTNAILAAYSRCEEVRDGPRGGYFGRKLEAALDLEEVQAVEDGTASAEEGEGAGGGG
jgi:hypothetical protein